jgi:RNA polymerase-binding transcription factor DksA
VPRQKIEAIWFLPASKFQVASLQEPLTPDPQRSVHRDGSRTALEAALLRLDLERAMSALITGALERTANGTYGHCVRCSAKIAAERLRALPWVRMCGDCQDVDTSSATETTSGGNLGCIDNSGA